jgi:fucose 4-O-acetylase-like acetyltransferase
MPFFFFVSGILFYRYGKESNSSFFDSKVLQLLYVYVVWSFIKELALPIRNYTTDLFGSFDIDSFLRIFFDPPATLWFIYALLLYYSITKIFFSKLKVLLFASVVLFFIVDSNLHFGIDFWTKISKYYFFFVLGVFLSNSSYVRTNRRPLWLVTVASFSFLAIICAYDFIFIQNKVLIFLTQVIGIFSLSVLSRYVVGGVASLFIFCGKKSLYIYLMHFLPIAVLTRVLGTVSDGYLSFGFFAVKLILGVSTPLFVWWGLGRWRVGRLPFAKPSKINVQQFLPAKPLGL